MNHNFAKNESRLADKSHFLRFILFILRTYILSYFNHYSNTLGDLRVDYYKKLCYTKNANELFKFECVIGSITLLLCIK